jgi:hypothetical protein
MPLRSNPYLISGPGEIRNKIYCEMFSDLTSNAFLQVSKSTALEAGGIFCLRSKNNFYDLRQALLFLRAIPEPWRFSVDTMSVNYQNTNYAHDVFEILRTFPNLRLSATFSTTIIICENSFTYRFESLSRLQHHTVTILFSFPGGPK